MNDKFYALSEEKQSQILNAGYKVFATNQYKKAPTSEIAAEAGISKSLLFHYFHNKLELYLFLWKGFFCHIGGNRVSIAFIVVDTPKCFTFHFLPPHFQEIHR